MSSPRVLFILKSRDNYGEFYSCYGDNRSSGLANSARFVCDMLAASGVESKLVHVVDNNCIDKEVHKFRPTHVVIEALWVVPEKFHALTKLHPSVKWIIRTHSELPFLANEGVAVEWIKAYVLHPNVVIAANSVKAVQDIRTIVRAFRPFWSSKFVDTKVVYLPNYYPVAKDKNSRFKNFEFNVACLGAIRPLKNQLIQAVAAIQYADENRLRLRFHVNSSRLEQGGANVYKNLVALFKDTPHELVCHDWMEHKDLLVFLRDMDLSLNVSFSETFNITASDAVSQDVPVVCSSEVAWTSPLCWAETTSAKDIVRKMKTVLSWHQGGLISRHNLSRLKKFSRLSRKTWLKYL